MTTHFAAPDADSPFRATLPWLLFITSLFFFNFIGRVILSPLMPAIEADLNLTHAQAGRLFLSISAGYCVMLFCSGFISSRLTHHTCVSLSTVAVGGMMIAVSLCESVATVQLLLIGMGVAGGLYLPSGIAAIATLVAPRNYGKAMAVHEVAPNFGFFLAPLLAEAFLAFTTWRIALGGIGGAAMLTGILFAIFGRGGTTRSATPNFHVLWNILRRRDFWLLVLLFSFAISAAFGPYSILPLYLTGERGMTTAQANQIMALSRVAGPLSAIISGWAADRFGARPTLTVYYVLTAVTTMLLALPAGTPLIAALLIQPMCSSLFFAAGLSVMARCFEPEYRSIAMSFISMSGVLVGMGIVPSVLGALGDSGGFATGILGVGCLVVLGFFLLQFLRPACGRTPSP